MEKVQNVGTKSAFTPYYYYYYYYLITLPIFHVLFFK